MIKGKNLKLLLLTSSCLFTMAAVATGVFSWFISSIEIGDINGTGVSDSAYFAYGTGTQDDPYGIKEVRHLNNLAWLQYNGKFDDAHYYFELASDVNAGGEEYVIPPIGTERHPFVGVFNGNGHTIYNVKVTNNTESFSKKPSNITYNQNYAEIIGFFGVVGNLDDEMYNSSVNSINDFTLEDFTVESITENTLIGLAAGFVNAEMSGVKVGTSTISVNGNSAKGAYSDKLSDYGLVGYTTRTGSSGTFEQKVSKFYDNSSQGFDPGWGGSIIIKDLYNRLSTIRSSKAKTNQSMIVSYADEYDTEGNRLSHTQYDNNNSTATFDVYNENYVKNNGTYDEKIGAVQMSYGDSGIYYLDGGHYVTSTTRNLASHTGYKITDGSGHYLTIASLTSNNSTNAGTLGNASEEDAVVWSVPTSGSGYISCSYHYNAAASATTYYLYLNGSTLQLSTSTNSRTSFTRSSGTNGKIKFTSGSYYIDYKNDAWGVSRLPDAPNPTTYSSYLQNGYQIYVDTNYCGATSNTTTSVQTSISSSNTYGWRFEYNGSDVTIENAVGKAVKIYTVRGNNNTKYYFTDTAGQNVYWRMNLATSSTDTFTVSQNSDGTYKFTLGSYVLVFDSGNTVFSCRTEGSNNTNSSIVVKTTQQVLNDYNSLVENSYNLTPTSQVTTTGPDYTKTARYSGLEFDAEDQDYTYLPINVNSNNQADDTNTGYIIGGSNHESATSSSVYGNVRISSFYQISSNLQNYNQTNKCFNKNSVWTVDSGGVHQIDDDNNNYVKYTESKGKIEQNLGTGSTIYGMHFMSAEINKDKVVNARYAKINGEEFENYKMPANSIDFNLKDQGYVNFFAGAYGNSGNSATTIDSFFSLHQIRRDGAEIDTINEIDEIYSDGVNGHSYIYKLSNGNYTIPYSIDKYNSKKLYVLNTKYLITDTEHGGYTDGIYHEISAATFNSTYSGSFQKVFEMSWLKDNTYSSGSNGYHQGFYFEIPVNPGEYALGTVANKTYGAYLMYLDIGANAANQDHITAYALTTTQTGLQYPLGVDFNTTDVTGDDGGETCAIVILAGDSSDGDVTFTVSGTTIGYEADFATRYSYSEKTVTGASPPDVAEMPPANGTRVIYTHIVSTDNSEWDIRVTELLDSEGNVTSSTYSGVVCDGENVPVEDIPESFVLNSIRPVVEVDAVTLTRLSGDNAFTATPVYSGTDFTTINISLVIDGISIEVHDIATGYTIIINNTTITTDPQIYPAA